MYSILPALVSILFLGYGAYVLYSRGATRIGLTFFLICAATFAWQSTWALLFQTRNEATALMLAKAGYLLILFLPTTLYHFITELTRRERERVLVYASYSMAAVLAVLLLVTDWLVAGVHHYFFGYYPKAGWLHPLHLLQTVAVVGRGLAMLFQRQRQAMSTERARLGYCLVSILIYFFAAVDYLCNYGVEFYPPGVLFIAVSLGLMAQAMVRHQLLADPLAAAATIAHEMRTPLATIRSQSRLLGRSLPELIAGYRSMAEQRDHEPTLRPEQLQYLGELAQHIEAEVTRSNFIVDMMLASARDGTLRRDDFAVYSAQACVDEALACYPFEHAMRDRVRLRVRQDFLFYGSDAMLVYVLYNLLKNALHALASAGRGAVEIELRVDGKDQLLVVTDTGLGIPPDVLPHVFDPYYTTRRAGGGTGMGLAFCERVIKAFGGSIACESELGRYSRFTLAFPTCRPSPAHAAEQHVAKHRPVAQKTE